MSPDHSSSPAVGGAPVISPPTLIDLQILIQQQFRKSVQLTGAAALMFLVAYVVTALIGRSGSPSPAVEELRASNHAVSTLAVQLAGQVAPVPAKTAQAFRSQLLSTLDQHARLAENASSAIGQQQAQEIPSAARDLLQLILVAGGAVMLGLLGLHRLQGIDAEIR